MLWCLRGTYPLRPCRNSSGVRVSSLRFRGAVKVLGSCILSRAWGLGFSVSFAGLLEGFMSRFL